MLEEIRSFQETAEMRTPRPFLRLIVSALLMSVIIGSPSLAQESLPTESAPAETSPPPAVTDIPKNAAVTRAELQEIRASLADDRVIAGIDEQLEPTTQAIDASKVSVDDRDLDRLNIRQLQRIQVDWLRFEDQVDQWLNQLRQRVEMQQENLALLSELRDRWVGARAAIVGQEGMQPLMERVVTVLAEIDEVEFGVRARLERLLASQERLVDAKTVIVSVTDRIDQAMQVARGRLLTRDSSTLWVAIFGETVGPSMTEGVGEIWSDQTRLLTDFLETDTVGWVLHVLWFLALLVPMIYLRRRGREWMSQQSSLERTAMILDRPISAAIVLGTLIARWTYQPMPGMYGRLLAVAILLPLLRLVVRIASRPLHTPLVMFGVLFVVDQLRAVFGSEELPGRLLLLLLTSLTLLSVLWIRHTVRTTMSSSDHWHRRLFPAIAGTAVAILATGVLANVAGIVGLATLLTDVILSCAYFVVLFYAGYLIVEGTVGVVLVSPLVRPLRSVWAHREAIRARVLRIVKIGLGIWWVWVTLGILQVRDAVVGRLASLFGSEWGVGTVTISFGNVLAGVITLWVAVFLSRVLRAVLEEDVMARLDMPRGVPATISMMVRYAVITLGVLFAAAVAGFDLSQFAFILGALGVGIGFGLQNVVNNFVSGLILAVERPIRVGDTVQTATLLGTVRVIGIRSSTVRTFDGAEVIVPNGLLIAGEVTNWTLSDRRRRIVLPVSVAYGSDVRRVQTLLIETVQKHESVLDQPAPMALFQGFGEYTLDFSLRYWTADYDNWITIGSDIAMAVNDALNEARIEIPLPQRDLHMRSGG